MAEPRLISSTKAVLAGLVALCLVGVLLAYRDLARSHGPERGALVAQEVLPRATQVVPGPVAPDPALRGPVLPTFDVVRVSPQGSAVVAGRAGAGSEVIVFDGGREVARATADQRGEFVALPSLPLAAGGRELTLAARGAGGAEVRGTSRW